MAKAKTVYFCNECGYETTGWLGKCPSCGAWNSIVEQKIPQGTSGKGGSSGGSSGQGWLEGLIQDIAEPSGVDGTIELGKVDTASQQRVASGMPELDRVLGGGFVPGSLILVAGDPGIGKSTLLLQVAALSDYRKRVLYVNGEESASQIKLRADRLGLKGSGIRLLPEVVFEQIARTVLNVRPELLIVDSIQTVYSEELTSAPGTVSQVREVTGGLLRLAKALNMTVVLVGHVTKDGAVAGPRVLEHMVDTVLSFEGDSHSQLRLLRATKNRFGATSEIGLFDMTDEGLSGVEDASEALLAGRPSGVPGSAVTCAIEGTRPILAEIQALLAPSAFANPQRQTQGLDRNRVSMLMAVMDKSQRLGLGTQDAWLNIVGGLTIDDTATDLAVASALASSFYERPLKQKILLCGELGLTSEVRPIGMIRERLSEAARLGFDTVLLPGANSSQVNRIKNRSGLPEIVFVDKLGEALDIALAKAD